MDTQAIRKEIAAEIKRLTRVHQMLGGNETETGNTPGPGRQRKPMSAAGRAKIAAAQKARWDKVRNIEAAAPAVKTKRGGRKTKVAQEQAPVAA